MESVIKNFEFSSYDYKAKEVLEMNIDDCLSMMGRRSHFPAIFYIVDELAANADRANLKRSYFLKKSIDIDSTKEYLGGIKDFKRQINSISEELSEISSKNKYCIKIEIDFDHEKFCISISNNNKILPIEVSKINNLINISKSFNSVEEVLKTNIDTTEGGGVGIILTMLTLKKMGFNENSFKIQCLDNSTTAKIEIDFAQGDDVGLDRISADAVNEIDAIPQFPEHILRIMNILENPNSNFDNVSEILKNDAALVADLIKTANSTMYILPKKVDSIEEVVRLLGIYTIKNLVITYTTNKIFMNKYNLSVIDEMMKHSSEVAFYGYEIARFLREKEDMDRAFIAGMLHDFGKIIIKSLRPEMIEKIEAICHAKGINNFFVESLTNGYNHSVVGYKLAQKWRFPPYLIDAIRYHHIPLQASEENRTLVYITYLANSVYYYKRGSLKFENINRKILKTFNLEEKDNFEVLSKGLFAKFENSKKR